jgi:hypothetical protein
MPNYLGPDVPAATFFFTVALAERGSSMLIREIGRLREAVRATRTAGPFGIGASGGHTNKLPRSRSAFYRLEDNIDPKVMFS